MRRAALIALVLFAAACSNTKRDPSAAFEAIFPHAAVDDVILHRGKLWQNTHLLVFYEFYAHLEFEASGEKVATLLASTGQTFTRFDATDFAFGLREDEVWFAPRDGSRYEGWRSNEGMFVIRSSTTGRVFAKFGRL